MNALPVASYLANFGVDSAVPASRPDSAAAAAAIEAQVESAYANGFESARAASRAELERKLEEQRIAYDARLAHERGVWVSQVSSELANRLNSRLGELQTDIADAVARILLPFLAADLRRQSMTSLQAELTALLRDDAGIELTISGPEDLLEALRQQLAGRAKAVYQPSESVDVRITAGRTVIETRLGMWLTKMQEAIQ